MSEVKSPMEKHYDESYFYAERHGGKKYEERGGGSEKQFGYFGGGLWNYQGLFDRLVELLGRPRSVLDIGSGTGGFPLTINRNGVKTLGLEFSEYAVTHGPPGARKYLKKWDLEDTPWPVDQEQYDWVTAIDLFEHLLEDRVEDIVRETKKRAKRYIIAKICTAQNPSEVWAADRGTYREIMDQAKREGYDWLTASGHVNSQLPQYWVNLFEDEEWEYRKDLANSFRVRGLRLPQDWRTTLIMERRGQKPQVPPTFTQEWYDEEYFIGSKGGKNYLSPNHTVRQWSYYNPLGVWEGCYPIARAWKKMFNPTNMLDVGAGRGPFIAAAREAGIKAVGFDYSQWAVGPGRHRECREKWLLLHDAREPWPYPDNSIDLTVCLDFLEHIYLDNLQTILDEMFRVSGKWVFIQVDTAKKGETYTLKKGEEPPLELQERAVAGHVTVKTEEWWYDRLDRDEWWPRRDLVNWFIGLVGDPVLRNWLNNTMIILERDVG